VYDDAVDEEPLLCPQGYICQLYHEVPAADDNNHIPTNRGRCVRQPPQPLSGLWRIFNCHTGSFLKILNKGNRIDSCPLLFYTEVIR